MGKIWDESYKYQKWLEVEIAVCEAQFERGNIPEESLKIIKERASFDINRIEEIEQTVKHEIIAFLTAVGEAVGSEAKYIHLGLTSSDVIDTGLALQMRESAELIIKDLLILKNVLREKAFQYKNTPCMGRTHGIHAEPMVLGLKFTLWYQDLNRCLTRIKQVLEVISIGKISGPIGTFSSVSPEVEEITCHKLGLKPEPVATQVVQRDRHAEYLLALALVASFLEKIALEIRHLQRTEVREVEEPFSLGQKGSSAMPHKKNPIGSENICGLARLVRSYALTSLENIALWHERDISHSSVERVIIPDSLILVDYMLNRLTGILQNLIVHPEKMLENLEASLGLYNSQKILLALTDKGLSREKAYELVQEIALECWEKTTSFKDTLSSNSEITKYLTVGEINSLFDFNEYLKYVDYIYNRVFNLGSGLHS
ncbi:MAG: Adenylosuccinate lyase [candidate division WS2 bacterium]|uniref:Adenylosuccinate lyase n=1 Tax=Psychracetigena formicireducens TaxID=2986056 RepID=A0A9E2F4R6_PSYF1|nr:Adenylosuccinate lyase [Candidatus Psychracetigena formicireducens]MBT9145361.1 Adenylosuccinate lyase [Candidatus Psychracetigena formicireducens]MBT9150472.1 Adenylosuccinate lyase [Candidatus Psychracetigena formicireducens]